MTSALRALDFDPFESSSSPATGGVTLRPLDFDPFSPSPSVPNAFKDEGVPAGLKKPGNLDLTNRPKVKNPDGSYSTVRTITVDNDDGAVNIPTVSPDGRNLQSFILKDPYAPAKQRFRDTGENLGTFDTDEHAEAAAEQLHEDQAGLYGDQQPKSGLSIPRIAGATREGFGEGPLLGGAYGPVTEEMRGYLRNLGLVPTAKNVNAFNTLTNFLSEAAIIPATGVIGEAAQLGSRAFSALLRGGSQELEEHLTGLGMERSDARHAAQTIGQMVEHEAIKPEVKILPREVPRREIAPPADVLAAPTADAAIAAAREAVSRPTEPAVTLRELETAPDDIEPRDYVRPRVASQIEDEHRAEMRDITAQAAADAAPKLTRLPDDWQPDFQPEESQLSAPDQGIPGETPAQKSQLSPVSRRPRTSENPTILDRIREMGGINLSKGDPADIAAILQDYKNPPFKRRLLNSQGLTPDQMRAQLQSEGWFGRTATQFGHSALETGSYPGDDIRDMADLIDRSVRGEDVYHPERAPPEKPYDPSEHENYASVEATKIADDAAALEAARTAARQLGLAAHPNDLDAIAKRIRGGTDPEGAVLDHYDALERAAVLDQDEFALEHGHAALRPEELYGELAGNAVPERPAAVDRAHGRVQPEPQSDTVATGQSQGARGEPAPGAQSDYPTLPDDLAALDSKALESTIERISDEWAARYDRGEPALPWETVLARLRREEMRRERTVHGVSPSLDDVPMFQRRLAEEPGAADARGNALPQTIIPGAEADARAARVAEENRKLQEMRLRAQQSKMRKGGQESVADQEGGMFSAERDQKPLFQRRDGGEETKPTFFSALTRGIESVKQEKASPGQWEGIVKNLPGVKQEEVDWSGLREFLGRQTRPVTKQEIVDFLNENRVDVKEVEKGAGGEDVADLQRKWDAAADAVNKGIAKRLPDTTMDGLRRVRDDLRERIAAAQQRGGTKFAQYTLPGGENYRELLLTLPERKTLSDAEAHERDALAVKGMGRSATEESRLRELNTRLEGGFGANFRSSHFDEPNVLAHVRFDDRTGPNGEKILHIAEVQSDWHQKGRREGYQDNKPYTGRSVAKIDEDMDASLQALEAADKAGFEAGRLRDVPAYDGASYKIGEWRVTHKGSAEAHIVKAANPNEAIARARSDFEPTIWERHPDLHAQHEALQQERNRAANARDGYRTGVPDAPFKQSWHELAMKRMLRYAAENGYDRLSWDTGETQAARYDLSKQISRVSYNKSGTSGFSDLESIEGSNKGQGLLTAYDHSGREVMSEYVSDEANIPDLIGKEMADRLLSQKPKRVVRSGMALSSRELSGLDLKVGGEGMRGFYDRILPQFLNKYAKKWGAKVEQAKIAAPHVESLAEFGRRVGYGSEVTPWLREQYQKAREQNSTPAHSMSITPAMRESVMQGQPLFQKGGEGGKPSAPLGRNQVVAPGGVVVEVAPELKAKRDNLAEALRSRLDALGLKDIATRVVDKIVGLIDGRTVDADGYSVGRLIVAAVDAKDAIYTLDHEAVHAMRTLDLFTPEEWAILEDASRRRWIKQHNINELYEGDTVAQRTEEAIAFAFSKWSRDRRRSLEPSAIRRIFDKVSDALSAIGNAFRGLGFDTPERIFARIERGEVGARQRPAEGGAQRGPSFMSTSAYHGTPHDFDEFSTEKIGSGEGAQSFGWGLYFAGNKSVAEYYRDALGKRAVSATVADSIIKSHIGEADLRKLGIKRPTFYSQVYSAMFEKDEPLVSAKRIQFANAGARDLSRQAIADAIADFRAKAKGKLYQVNLVPDEGDWLDLDRPLAGQSDKVKGALAAVREQLEKSDMLDEYEEQKNAEFGEWTGRELVKQIIPRMVVDDAIPYSDSPLERAVENGDSAQATSLYLKSLGIPGSRFLDQASRGAGDGSHNYVVFDAGDVKIEAKFQRRPPSTSEPGLPLREEPPGEEPLPKYAGNINLDRIKAPEDIKRVINEVAKSRPEELDAARRGTISQRETEALANMLGMTPGKLLQRRLGRAFNAEEALAARQVLVKSADDVFEKSRTARGGSDRDMLAFHEALTRHVAIQEQVAGIAAEAGRALASFKILADKGAKAEALKRMVDAAGGRENIEAIAEMLSKLNSPEAISQFAKAAYKPTTWDMVTEAWINGLLSGPQTHVVNAASNLLTALMAIPEAAIASGLGAFRTGERVMPREIVARLYGTVQGAIDGARAAGRAFATGTPTDMAGKIEQRRYQAIPSLTLREGKPKAKIGGVPIPFTGEVKLGGKQVRVPGRALMASDEFFKGLARRQEMNARATRQALSEGLKGDALAKRIDELVREPTETMREAAHKYAEHQTFTDPLGAVGQSVQRIVQEMPALRFIIPFVRTPTNILKYSLERTPAAFLFKKTFANDLRGKNGAIRQDEARARVLLGSAIATAVAYYASQGVMTGGGPDDPQERALWMVNHRPYSFRTPAGWVPYGRLEPLATIMGTTADAVEISDKIGVDDMGKIAAFTTGAIARNLTNKTFLSGISDAISAFHDPERYGESWAQTLAGSVVPSAVAQYTRTEDPFVRDARGVIATFKSRLPGESESLKAKRDGFGEPIKRPSTGSVTDIFNPFIPGEVANDPVAAELERLSVRIPSVPKKLGKVELTPDEHDDLARLTGRLTKRILAPIIESQAYKNGSDALKQTMIEEAMPEARRAAKGLVETPGSDLVKRETQQKVDNAKALVPAR